MMATKRKGEKERILCMKAHELTQSLNFRRFFWKSTETAWIFEYVLVVALVKYREQRTYCRGQRQTTESNSISDYCLVVSQMFAGEGPSVSIGLLILMRLWPPRQFSSHSCCDMTGASCCRFGVSISTFYFRRNALNQWYSPSPPAHRKLWARRWSSDKMY